MNLNILSSNKFIFNNIFFQVSQVSKKFNNLLLDLSISVNIFQDYIGIGIFNYMLLKLGNAVLKLRDTNQKRFKHSRYELDET